MSRQDHLIIRTYSDLAKYAHAWAEGQINLLILVGNPGLSKSRTFKAALQRDQALPHRVLEGTVSAFQLFRELFLHIHHLCLIDDADGLFYDKPAVRLLKLVCQTEPVKTVSWNTATNLLKSAGPGATDIPREFETKSPVCIVLNELDAKNKNVLAVTDRGLVLHFEPDAAEVHREVEARRWFNDQEIFSYVGRHSSLISKPSIRHYKKAAELKVIGEDWRGALQQFWGLTSDARVVLRLADDPSFRTEKDRIAAFERETGRSRQTYFNLKTKLGLTRPRLHQA